MTEARVIPARQARSRETHERLMKTAERLFAAHGIPETTVGDLAEGAGIAVGTFYGRFPDKDAFLEAFYERFFSRAAAAASARFEPAAWIGRPAREIIEALARQRVQHYTKNALLLRALLVHVRAHPSEAFTADASRYSGSALQQFKTLLLERRASIGHPDPEYAILLGVLVLENAVKELVLFSKRPYARTAASRERFATELTRGCCAYLGIAV